MNPPNAMSGRIDDRFKSDDSSGVGSVFSCIKINVSDFVSVHTLGDCWIELGEIRTCQECCQEIDLCESFLI